MTDNKEEEDFGDNCLIEDEPEDGDDVMFVLISQGLEVDMSDITKQCEGMEPKVKARDAKNQVSSIFYKIIETKI